MMTGMNPGPGFLGTPTCKLNPLKKYKSEKTSSMAAVIFSLTRLLPSIFIPVLNWIIKAFHLITKNVAKTIPKDEAAAMLESQQQERQLDADKRG
jgi:hypothetical protein